MNVVLDVNLKKELEKNDILVFDGKQWVNLSKDEYLAKTRDNIKELKEADKILADCLNMHENRLDNFNERDLFIAKSIYDNYIERGLIDENEDFDEKFYNFIFNNYELKEEDLDEDYVKILEKVRL